MPANRKRTRASAQPWGVGRPAAWCALASVLVVGCRDAALQAAGTPDDLVIRAYARAGGVDADPTLGAEQPAPDDPRITLGRELFHARSLSADVDVACATCHHPTLAFADGLSLSVGVASGTPSRIGPGRSVEPSFDEDPHADGGPNAPRNAPSLANVGLAKRSLFWDGRVEVDSSGAIRTTEARGEVDPRNYEGLLEAAVAGSLVDAWAMRGYTHQATPTRDGFREALVSRLRGDTPDARVGPARWLEQFRVAYGRPDATAEEVVDLTHVVDALATYLRSEVFVDHRFGAYLRGSHDLLSASEKRGARDFLTPRGAGGAGCVSCHAGPRFTDESYRVAAFPEAGRGLRGGSGDLGRTERSLAAEDRHAFRVPSLLNVSVTGPYGHAGTFETLEEVVRYHLDATTASRTFDLSLPGSAQLGPLGGARPGASARLADAAASLDSALVPLGAFDEARVRDLTAFLRTLTDACLLDPACRSTHAPTGEAPDATRLTPSPDDVPKLRADDPARADRDAPTATRGLSPFAERCDASPATTSGPTAFVDVAVERGLTHVPRARPETWSADLAFEKLLVNQGASAGDLDDDCWTDLAFAADDAVGLRIYRGDPSGHYVDASDTLPASLSMDVSSATIVDLDGDRRSELVVPTLFDGSPARLAGDARAGFTLVDSLPGVHGTQAMAAGDLDGDGDPDLVAGHWTLGGLGQGTPFLYRNLGDGRFESADGAYRTTLDAFSHDHLFAPSVLDIDEDGDTDVLVTGDWGSSRILLQDDRNFLLDATDPAVVTDENGMGSAVFDFDGDLDLDWFVTSISDPNGVAEGNWGVTGNRLYRNDGRGRFVDASATAGVRDGAWGWGACAGDFDLDGDLDLFHENGFGLVDDVATANAPQHLVEAVGLRAVEFLSTPARYFENDGQGVFVDRAGSVGLSVPSNGRSVVCFDADRDGDLDLAVARDVGAPRLHLNQTGNARGFLGVRLTGAAPNTAALGAVVLVRAGGRTMRRDVALHSHHGGHDPLDVHFGLAGATRVEELRVRWPDGSPDTVLADVPASRFLRIRHPSLDPVVASGPHEARALANTSARIEAWLGATATAPETLAVIASIARRRADAGAMAALRARYAALESAATAADAAALRAFARAVDGSRTLAAEDRGALDPTRTLWVDVLHCDRRPEPDLALRLETLLATNPSEGLLLASFAISGACDVDGLRAPIAAAMDRLLDELPFDTGVVDVQRLSALSALVALGREDLVPPRFIEQVLDSVGPGGVVDTQRVPGAARTHSADESAGRLALILLAGLVDRHLGAESLAP